MAYAVLEAARKLGPAISGRSAEIEELATLPLDLVDAIRPCGAFRQFVPDDLGGPGGTVWESLQAIEEFAYHDGSVGWCVAISATTSLMASYLPDEHARALFADPRAIGAGFVMPRGRAVPVEGGLLVTGRWQWGSGSKHATTIGGGAVVVDDDGVPCARSDGLAVPFVFMDPDDVEFIETWDVAGLRGTGSVDFAARDAFVPEGRWAQIGAGEPERDNAYSRFSFYGLLASGVAATSVGIARRSMDELALVAGGRKPQGSSRLLSERVPIQGEVADCEARLSAAWALMREAVEDSWQGAVAARSSTIDQRRRIRLAATHATLTSADVTAAMFRAAGGASVFAASPIQRCFRDTAVAAQHAIVAPRTLETIGRMRLGLDTDTRTL